MSKKTAGIILTSAFVMPGSNTYQEYLDYMERNEATRNEHFDSFNAFSPTNQSDSVSAIEGGNETMFATYNDYMSNPEKTSALFTKAYDKAPNHVVQEMKNYFEEAQKNKSPLWQMVFSFRNEWLVKHHYLDAETNHLNKEQLYQATRLAIEELEKKEGLKGEWTGAIHYNTDNIHIHVGYVEKNPTREWINYTHPKDPSKSGWQFKGKFLQKNIRATKRVFVNELMQNKEQLAMLETCLNHQKKMAESCKEQFSQGIYEEKFLALLDKLPDNQYFWKYGFAEKHHFKQEVDQLITHFLEDDGQELMAKILPKLEKISNEYEEAYGNPRNEPTYFEQKLYGKNGLYSKIGNLILQEAKNQPELRQKKKGAGGFRESDLDWRPEPSEDAFTKPAEEFLSLDTTVPPEIAVEETTDLPLEPLLQEVPSTSSSIRSSKEQQIDTKMEQSIDRLQQYFHQNKERLDKRNQEFMHQESLSKINGKVEKRGMHIRQVTGAPYSEPASIFTHDKLAKEILLTDSDYTEQHNLHESNKKIKTNLHVFSNGNQRAILQTNPQATFLLGDKQWQLNHRQVKEEEKDNPIEIVSLKKEADGSFTFEKKEIFDISQTEELPEKVRNVNRKIEQRRSTARKKPVSIKQNPQKYLDVQFRKQMRHLRKACQGSLQRYLNEKVYQELEQSMSF